MKVQQPPLGLNLAQDAGRVMAGDVFRGGAQLAATQGEPVGHHDVVDGEHLVPFGVDVPRAGAGRLCHVLLNGEAVAEELHQVVHEVILSSVAVCGVVAAALRAVREFLLLEPEQGEEVADHDPFTSSRTGCTTHITPSGERTTLAISVLSSA
jgi:hypothetical protein